MSHPFGSKTTMPEILPPPVTPHYGAEENAVTGSQPGCSPGHRPLFTETLIKRLMPDDKGWCRGHFRRANHKRRCLTAIAEYQTLYTWTATK